MTFLADVIILRWEAIKYSSSCGLSKKIFTQQGCQPLLALHRLMYDIVVTKGAKSMPLITKSFERQQRGKKLLQLRRKRVKVMGVFEIVL